MLLGNSKPMQEVYKSIGKVAQSDAPVLIHGETGTGKELVAQAVLANSPRRELWSWIARATSSLPVPLSPVISTEASPSATWAITS